jgi:Zn-dependent protease with chaperone function
VLKAVGRNTLDRLDQVTYQANAVLVSERQYPSLYYMTASIQEKLGLSKAIPIYVVQNPIPNAAAHGIDNIFITVNSGVIDLLDSEKLSFIMAHEMGHVVFGHVAAGTTLRFLLNVSAKTLGAVPALSVISPLLSVASLLPLMKYVRACEYTADRVGLFSTGDLRASIGAQGSLAGGSLRLANEFSYEAYLEQVDAYSETDDVLDGLAKGLQNLSMLGATHPLWVHRSKALREWYLSGDFGRLVHTN